MNYAEKGWSNTQEMIGLIEQLKHATRKPDIVLFYDGGTEAFAAYQSDQADVHSNYNSFKNFLDNWGATQKGRLFLLPPDQHLSFSGEDCRQSALSPQEGRGDLRGPGYGDAFGRGGRQLRSEHGHREPAGEAITASARFSPGIRIWQSGTRN